uniref:Transcription cofactor HES-6-like n=1 Tax=Pundamilia nyererei TaxID=303518 RepID=A0A3B4G3A1_9CICH
MNPAWCLSILFLLLLPDLVTFLQLRKPLIERKRRERINNCLDQLKETVIGAFLFSRQQSKLEKADILEMTVKHLQNIQNNKVNGLEAQQRYSTGYIQCMHEVHNMLLTCDWMDKTLGSRLLNHLLKSLPRSTDEHPLTLPTPRLDAALPATQAVPGSPLRRAPRLAYEFVDFFSASNRFRLPAAPRGPLRRYEQRWEKPQ